MKITYVLKSRIDGPPNEVLFQERAIDLTHRLAAQSLDPRVEFSREADGKQRLILTLETETLIRVQTQRRAEAEFYDFLFRRTFWRQEQQRSNARREARAAHREETELDDNAIRAQLGELRQRSPGLSYKAEARAIRAKLPEDGIYKNGTQRDPDKALAQRIKIHHPRTPKKPK